MPAATAESLGQSTAPNAVDLTRWSARLEELSATYCANTPFPHIHLADFLERGVAETMERAFPSPSTGEWTHYRNYNLKKLGNAQRETFPPVLRETIDELMSPPFVAWLSELTGIPGLLADPSLEGAGLHQIERGGYLNVHADFTMHSHRSNWRRRLNLLLYLNSDWQHEWNGAIELWDRGMTGWQKRYPPALNHLVVFSTDEHSYHGHPEPLRCPDGRTRKSIILYYYTVDDALQPPPKATNYRPRPGDSAGKRFMVWADGRALALYYRLKRRYKFSDKVASRVLARLFPRR
jgi:hypothetical protein